MNGREEALTEAFARGGVDLQAVRALVYHAPTPRRCRSLPERRASRPATGPGRWRARSAGNPSAWRCAEAATGTTCTDWRPSSAVPRSGCSRPAVAHPVRLPCACDDRPATAQHARAAPLGPLGAAAASPGTSSVPTTPTSAATARSTHITRNMVMGPITRSRSRYASDTSASASSASRRRAAVFHPHAPASSSIGFAGGGSRSARTRSSVNAAARLPTQLPPLSAAAAAYARRTRPASPHQLALLRQGEPIRCSATGSRVRRTRCRRRRSYRISMPPGAPSRCLLFRTPRRRVYTQ
jgi:hypothetical protein